MKPFFRDLVFFLWNTSLPWHWSAAFARDVCVTGSPKIGTTNSGSHYPDGLFAHIDATQHGAIMEFSDSRKSQDLPFLADEYIVGSLGLTQLAIRINLTYQNKGKEARVMEW